MWYWGDGTCVGSPIDCDGYSLPKISQEEITRQYKKKYGQSPRSLPGLENVYHSMCNMEEQHRLYHAIKRKCSCVGNIFTWKS